MAQALITVFTIKVACIILNNIDILILASSIYIFYDCFVYLQAKLKRTILNLVIPFLILVYYYWSEYKKVLHPFLQRYRY